MFGEWLLSEDEQTERVVGRMRGQSDVTRATSITSMSKVQGSRCTNSRFCQPATMLSNLTVTTPSSQVCLG